MSALATLGEARRMLGVRRRRTLLSGIGVFLAAAMLGAAVVIAVGLGGGFSRAVARADLGDLVVRFRPESPALVARRISALPDIDGFAMRSEATDVTVAFGGRRTGSAVGEALGPGRRQGIALVAGRRVSGPGREVDVEPAWAAAWGMHVGSMLSFPGLGRERIAGFVEGPDDVGYPLGAPRFYLTDAQLARDFGVAQGSFGINYVQVWLRDPRYVSEVLVQARDESLGLHDLQFATRSGVQVLIGQAAGIVIDLLVALSAIALATAAVMLGASARAEVQRRLRSIGIRRAVGASRRYVAAVQATEAALVAVPAASLGLAVGVLATLGPIDRLLGLLNQPGPGSALVPWLVAGWLAAVAVPVLGAAWPAWVAAGSGVISLLRGADVVRRRGRSAGAGRSVAVGRGSRGLGGGGLGALGARLVAARPARLFATVTMLAASTAFVLLLICLAATLSSLETDPQVLGKRYQLTATAAPDRAAEIARLPGVAGAAPRFEVRAVDGYSLGELIDVIAYPGDHVPFEAPPLASGRRLRGSGQAEVGVGLANALGLAPGSPLLLELPNGRQLSLRVAGTVDSLSYSGLVAYVPAAALLAADPDVGSHIAVRVALGASASKVADELRAIGAPPAVAAGAVARGAPLVAVLKTILRAVAVVDGLVCLYALVQACALTMQERRRTVAVLRASGASARAVRRLLGGAVFVLIAPAALVGVLVQAFVLGPVLSRLAASYAALDLSPGPLEIGGVLVGLALAGWLAVVWVSRGALRESVVTGLAG